LNEGENLGATLAPLRVYRQQGHELIVVDGGSNDDTISIARAHADQVLQTNSGRAHQMNRGIEVAQGDVLLFLHADTRLPPDALEIIIDRVINGYYWGRFNVRLTGQHFMFRIIERMMNLRSCLTGVATGDQAIFVSRECTDIVGHYPEVPLMEDVLYSKRLRTLGWPACVRLSAVTSSRRWENRGILRTMLLMWRLRLLLFFGVPTEKLAQQYH
jgi:rSAM/selenodomain-associated transferase 2